MCVLDKTQGVMKHRLFLILLMWCLFSKSCLGIFMWLMFRTSDSIYTVGSHTVSEYLLKNLLTPCHEVSPVMLSGFEHVCFTLMLKIVFYHGARLSFFFFWCGIFNMLWLFSVLLWSLCLFDILLFLFFTLEEWGWQEDRYRFEVAWAGAGAEHSGVQTSEGKTGQNRDWAPDHCWRVSAQPAANWITLAWRTCVLCWTCNKWFS